MAGRDLLAEQKPGRDLLADDGVNPVPVAEDQPGWDWLRINAPGVFNRGHEFFAGVGDTLSDLPNLVPNIGNTAKSLYDLHFGTGTGNVAPEDQFKPWMDDKVGYISRPGRPFAESYPPLPGYEEWRRMGQVSGGALPLGPAAAVAAPLLSEGGKAVGWFADRYLDPNENQKWAKTGEIAAPLVTGGVTRGAKTAGVKLGIAPETAVSTGLGLTGMAFGADPLSSMVATLFGKPITDRVVRAVAPYVGPVVSKYAGRPSAAVLGTDASLPNLLGRSLAPTMTEDERRRGAR